ncbi:MAG: hypothetical protein J7639_16295 [Paenibacillaceae bacterium]|nr:hypothetical protein [Paenibacillaceae bacterium]
MNRISLDGQWQLTYFPQNQFKIENPHELRASGAPRITATVPGNVELDLMEAGVLPDLYHGSNIRQLRDWERHEWWYETSFETPAASAGKRTELVFGGADCFATYWLNGERIGESDNMLIAHTFDVTGKLRADGPNALVVRLRSPLLEALQYEYEPSMLALWTNWESLWVRKAPHGYGWDIMPRALSAGLWRSVEVVWHEANEVTDLYAATLKVAPDHSSAQLDVFYQFDVADPALFFDGLEIRLTGTSGSSVFQASQPAVFAAGSMWVTVEQPRLWWPRGYGEAALYELKAELVHRGRVLAARTTTIGIREAELIRSEVTNAEGSGEFLFRVNGVPIMCKGSNWVPLDAFHSRDAARYEQALDLFRDTESNIVRCWGGNVYEDDAFYNLCDRLGIMVWQDFGMACAVHPQAPSFTDKLLAEAKHVLKKLRNHPSILLWCGDNECDQMYIRIQRKPMQNRITRELLPEAVALYDPHRAYLPSSPYLAPGIDSRPGEQLAPERHLWGPRDYYKSKFYQRSNYHFVSEIGYHGCPNLSSLEKFLDADSLWPWQDNEQWLVHSTETIGWNGPYSYRIKLMADQIKELFGAIPDNLPDFILASQVSQAEAKKYFVEMTRLGKWRRTGVIWWNMLDGWPQFSDAVVDYYFGKKLAYHYLRRAQQPVCLMIDEPDSWHVNVHVGNDSLADAAGTYRVWDADSGETLLEGDFAVKANENRKLGSIRISHSDKRVFLMQWTIGGQTHGNHYLLGFPAFALDAYKKWLEPIAALTGEFAADQVGQ